MQEIKNGIDRTHLKNNTKKSSALVCKVIVMLLELFYICTIYGRMHCLL